MVQTSDMTVPSNSLSDAFSRCLNLFENGGSVVNLKYDSERYSIEDLFDRSWVQKEMKLLSMANVAIPKHGCFCLLHPGILFWEEDRDDVQLLHEEE